MPRFDRDSGSRRLLDFISFLQEAGCRVTFLSAHEADSRHSRYVRHLQQLGVPVFQLPVDPVEELVLESRFDIALLTFWPLAELVAPIFRKLSPATRIVVDSVDLHFLRDARRFLTTTGPGPASVRRRLRDAAGRGAERLCRRRSRPHRVRQGGAGARRLSRRRDAGPRSAGLRGARPVSRADEGPSGSPLHRELPPRSERPGGRVPVPADRAADRLEAPRASSCLHRRRRPERHRSQLCGGQPARQAGGLGSIRDPVSAAGSGLDPSPALRGGDEAQARAGLDDGNPHGVHERGDRGPRPHSR